MAWTTLSLLKLEELYYPLKSKIDQLITAVPFHALGVLLAHQGYDDIPLLLGHLGGDGQQHQHVVALGHAHRVQVAQHVGASDLAWKSNEPFLRHYEARFGVFNETASRKKNWLVLLTTPGEELAWLFPHHGDELEHFGKNWRDETWSGEEKLRLLFSQQFHQSCILEQSVDPG